jgi:hypothetical protein
MFPGKTITLMGAKILMSGRDALEMKAQADAVDASEEVDMSNSPPPRAMVELERRGAEPDRRKRTLHSLLYGSFNPRRRGARRTGPATLRDLDWHEPQWLAVAMLIVVLSCVDAALTLTLIEYGAYEVNPLMAPIVGGSALIFTLIKVGLTAGGVVLLTLLARMRAFGKIPVSFLLYAVLIGYGSLVIYELRLLEEISFT